MPQRGIESYEGQADVPSKPKSFVCLYVCLHEFCVIDSSPVHSSPSLPPSRPCRVAAGETEAPDLKLRNGEDVSLVQDLITLPHLHEPAILHSLQERFEEGAIYTFTGRERGSEGGRERKRAKQVRF